MSVSRVRQTEHQSSRTTWPTCITPPAAPRTLVHVKRAVAIFSEVGANGQERLPGTWKLVSWCAYSRHVEPTEVEASAMSS